jgi:anaerobic selenocysteine-containing dehydrogenase
MGFVEPSLYESDRDVIAHVLAPTGLDFTELRERGTVWPQAEPVIQFADLRFPTPSGRIELASDAAQAEGLPRTAQPHADTRPRDGRLRLLSPASRWILNDTFANDPKLSKRVGRAAVAMHPQDAAQRGLVAGDLAILRSTVGELQLTVALSEDLPRGVAYSPKGHWPKREFGGANVNVLNPGEESDMGRSSAVHGIEVTVTPA